MEPRECGRVFEKAKTQFDESREDPTPNALGTLVLLSILLTLRWTLQPRTWESIEDCRVLWDTGRILWAELAATPSTKFDLEASHQMGGGTVRCLGEIQRAERRLETVKGRGGGENDAGYNSLITLYAKNGDVNQAEHCLNTMTNGGIVAERS